MLKEQNQTLRHEIIRQAQRAEAAALLTSAHDMQSKDGIPHTQKEDDRLNDLFDHLKETCDSKDEVLVRLFDLVCLREVCDGYRQGRLPIGINRLGCWCS